MKLAWCRIRRTTGRPTRRWLPMRIALTPVAIRARLVAVRAAVAVRVPAARAPRQLTNAGVKLPLVRRCGAELSVVRRCGAQSATGGGRPAGDASRQLSAAERRAADVRGEDEQAGNGAEQSGDGAPVEADSAVRAQPTSMPTPSLPDPNNRTAARRPIYSSARIALAAQPVDEPPLQDDGGWRAAKE